MRASSYTQIADHLDAGGRVLLGATQGDKIEHTTAYRSDEFRRAARTGRNSGMLPVDEYELEPLLAAAQVDVAALERKHHNRVSGLQRKVRRARAARERAERLLSERDAAIARLRENERELASTLGRVASERDRLKERLEPVESAVAANPERPTVVVHLFDLAEDDVIVASGAVVGRLWRKDGEWLHAGPEDQGYQPVPFESGTRNRCVRVFERRLSDEYPPLLLKAEAEAQGYTVDTTTYPWTGYKGPRFEPTVAIAVHTPAVER